jgi:uncharacterized protein YcbK (DUF882 family)
MVPLPSRLRHPILRRRLKHPWWGVTRRGKHVREWLDRHGYITPHFTWASYACQDARRTPVPHDLRANAIRLHWDLEQLRHRLGDRPMTVDGPYRTPEHNRAVGGASDSRHVHADGADFFDAQVKRWGGHKRALAAAEAVFANGGLGNENSGTLHVDARGHRARFITWTPTS